MYYINFSRHHHHQKTSRKYSLPDEAGKKHDGRTRRVSNQPEDMELRGADRDQMESHRSDDARALRRHKTRPSATKDQLEPSLVPFIKKSFDHSPRGVGVYIIYSFSLTSLTMKTDTSINYVLCTFFGINHYA